jgi:hypothetical protein
MAKVAAAKTVPTAASVAAFLGGVADPARRGDCEALVASTCSTAWTATPPS